MIKQVKVDEVVYNIRIIGKGKPIVFLHGFSESLMTFNKIQITDRQLIMIDQIGHGKTESPLNKNVYSLTYMTESLHDLLKILVNQPFDLVGYSMGGRLALFYASRFPKYLCNLILESTSYGIEKKMDRRLRLESDEWLMLQLKEGGIEWFVNYWSQLPIFDSQKFLSEEIKETIMIQRRLNNPNNLGLHLLTMGQGIYPCLKNQLGSLEMPVLYIAGETDYKYHHYMAGFKSECKVVTTKIMKGCGHNTHIEDPKTYSDIISRFLNKEAL